MPGLQRTGIERARSLGKYGGKKADAAEAAALSRMGFSTSEIAEALGVSPSTVRRYIHA